MIAWTVSVNDQDSYYTGIVEFNNNYGTLAGSDFPKLPVSPTQCIFDAFLLRVRKEAHCYCLEGMAPANFSLVCGMILVLRNVVVGLHVHRYRMDGPLCQALARDFDCPALHFGSHLLLDG